jgi:hypothetical protein
LGSHFRVRADGTAWAESQRNTDAPGTIAAVMHGVLGIGQGGRIGEAVVRPLALRAIGIAALILAILLLRRRKEKRSDAPDAPVPVTESEYKPMEIYQSPQIYEHHVSELQGHDPAHELPP